MLYLCLFFLGANAWGSSGDRDHHGHKKGHTVIQGPVGPRGEPGKDGQSIIGPSGDDGLDATRANVGAEIEWHEWKRASLYSGYRYDTLHHGQTWDLAVLRIKVGKGYAERQIDALSARIEALEASAVGSGKVREITIRGSK